MEAISDPRNMGSVDSCAGAWIRGSRVMGWSYGYVDGRDVGYGVPALCDHPDCSEEIDRGLAYICGSDIGGGEYGCGLFFCDKHTMYRRPRGADHMIQLCPRCYRYRPPYKPKPDVPEWLRWKLRDGSWYEWRKENPDGEYPLSTWRGKMSKLKRMYDLLLLKLYLQLIHKTNQKRITCAFSNNDDGKPTMQRLVTDSEMIDLFSVKRVFFHKVGIAEAIRVYELAAPYIETKRIPDSHDYFVRVNKKDGNKLRTWLGLFEILHREYPRSTVLLVSAITVAVSLTATFLLKGVGFIFYWFWNIITKVL
jgi:hypothetical protein